MAKKSSLSKADNQLLDHFLRAFVDHHIASPWNPNLDTYKYQDNKWHYKWPWLSMCLPGLNAFILAFELLERFY